jgi:hypothetical protein
MGQQKQPGHQKTFGFEQKNRRKLGIFDFYFSKKKKRTNFLDAH